MIEQWLIAFLWLAFIKSKKKARSEQGVKGQESVESCTQHLDSRDMNGQGDLLHVSSGGQNHLALLLQDCRRPLEPFETNQVSSSCLTINLFILYFSHSFPFLLLPVPSPYLLTVPKDALFLLHCSNAAAFWDFTKKNPKHEPTSIQACHTDRDIPWAFCFAQKILLGKKKTQLICLERGFTFANRFAGRSNRQRFAICKPAWNIWAPV